MEKPPFEGAPERARRRVFGVDYLHLIGKQSGDLWVTRHGWPVVESLCPSRWFVGEKFKKVGRALAGATGAVYRVPVPHPVRAAFALVVKFNRFGQEALIRAEPGIAQDWAEAAVMEAGEFLSPFEEFANLERLKAVARIRGHLPLAIYSPPTRYREWELGRRSGPCWTIRRRLEADQAMLPEDRRVVYDWERLYILLYRWLDGIDAETACRRGLLGEESLAALTLQTKQVLHFHGWQVLDHKPRHLILRHRNGGLLKRRGEWVWGLVDYELLMPVASGQGSHQPEVV
ncbi:MAG: hypothetical protein SNJ84_03175 [Verrucomicrobiia bacterium]